MVRWLVRTAYALALAGGLLPFLLTPAWAPIPQFVSGSATASVTLTTTTETALVSTTGLNTYPNASVRVECMTIITAGTGTTAITPRIRRGSGTGGALVGNANAVTVTAGNTVVLIAIGEDVPGEVAGQLYTCTAQQTAATGNGTALQSEIWAVTF